MRRKHATNESVQFPHNCEICEKDSSSLKYRKKQQNKLTLIIVAFPWLERFIEISVILVTSHQRQWKQWMYTSENVTGQNILNVVFANLLTVYQKI